jgi:hypothetical protein
VVDDALSPTPAMTVMRIRLWFDTVMDRTTENFLLKTRWITAGVALVLAFTLHVDSLRIIRQLAAQPELRAKLMQHAETALQKAESNFVLTAGQQAVASAAVADLANQFADHPALGLITNAPANLITREAGKAWLNAQLAGAPDREAILAAYEQNFDQRTAIWLADLRSAAADIQADLKESSLTIIPARLPPWGDYWRQPSHLLGTLMTVLFLSLGAPFWYNMLRQLSNLRPAVAQKIEPNQRCRFRHWRASNSSTPRQHGRCCRKQRWVFAQLLQTSRAETAPSHPSYCFGVIFREVQGAVARGFVIVEIEKEAHYRR